MHAKRTYFAGKPAKGHLRARPMSPGLMNVPQRMPEVAAAFNARPRETLGWMFPAQAVNRPLCFPPEITVATTA